MGEELQLIVVRVIPSHPTGTRRRAGFTFTQDPISINVTSSQLDEIKNDQYLKIVERGTAYEQGLQNFVDPTNRVTGDDLGDVKDDVLPSIPEKELTKAEITEKLIEKGLQAGVDFNTTAKKEVLLQLLNS